MSPDPTSPNLGRRRATQAAVYRLKCEVCSWQRLVSQPDDIADLHRLAQSGPAATVPRFRCPGCGRVVRPHKLTTMITTAKPTDPR